MAPFPRKSFKLGGEAIQVVIHSDMAESIEEEVRCRVCLEKDESTENPLLRPCPCSGSMAVVHAKCWQQCKAVCTVCKFPDEQTQMNQVWDNLQKGLRITVHHDCEGWVGSALYIPSLILELTAYTALVGKHKTFHILGIGYGTLFTVTVLYYRQTIKEIMTFLWKGLKDKCSSWWRPTPVE